MIVWRGGCCTPVHAPGPACCLRPLCASLMLFLRRRRRRRRRRRCPHCPHCLPAWPPSHTLPHCLPPAWLQAEGSNYLQVSGMVTAEVLADDQEYNDVSGGRGVGLRGRAL